MATTRAEVERVAKLLYEVACEARYGLAVDWKEAAEWSKEPYRAMARAVVRDRAKKGAKKR